MDHLHGDGLATPTNELQLHGHTNSNCLGPSISTSEVQILYMPIASPPTPSPSPRLAANANHLSFQPFHTGQASLLPAFGTSDPSLRREYLSSVIRSCTPEELLFISQTISILLKPKFSLSIPEEIILHIFLCIDDMKTLLNASLASKQWLRIARDENIWKAMINAYEFEDLEEAMEEWHQKQKKAIHYRKQRAKRRQFDGETSSTETFPLQDEGEYSSPSTLPASIIPPFSYRLFCRDTCIIQNNWRRGGKLLQSHRLPIISPDSGTVTSLAIDRKWVVIGLANSMIKVYNARTGILVRTLRGHDSGVWGVCLVSQGGHMLPNKSYTTASRDLPPKSSVSQGSNFDEWRQLQDVDGRAGGNTAKKKKLQSDGKDGEVLNESTKDREWKRRATDTKEKSTDGLRPHMTKLSMNSSRGGSHIMPDAPQAYRIPQAMRLALGLGGTSDSSQNDGSGSSSEAVSDRDMGNETGGSSSKPQRPRHHISEDEDDHSGDMEEERHEKPFNMTYSSHGWGQPNSIIVSGGCDKVVRVWDLKSGQCIYVLHGHLSTIRSLRVLNNRPIAVTGSRDNTLRVWDVQMGRCLRVLEGHQSSVRCLDVFGDRVVSGSYDHTCRLWNIDTGECLHVLSGHFSQIYSVAFDGVRVASGGLDTTVRIWDAETGQCIALLQGHTALVCQLQLSPTILATGGSDGRVITFSLETYKVLHRIAAHDSSVTSLQFDKNFLLTGGNDGRVRVYETATGAFVREFSEPSESVWKAAFVRGTCAVMCKRADKTVVEIWSLNPKTTRKRVK